MSGVRQLGVCLPFRQARDWPLAVSWSLRSGVIQTALTIGNFDGVHLGHQALVTHARRRVGPGGRVIAIVFDPHPMSVLRPEAAPESLTTISQREARLVAAGANSVERLEPTRALLGLTPEAFMRAKVERYAPSFVVEGEDFHFGKGRAGSVATLHELGAKMNFVCEVVPPVEVALADHQIVRASSTMLRWLMSHGRVGDVARLLGRPMEVAGVVVPGDRRGREIGVPTANLDTPQMLPADGIYAAIAVLPDGREVPAAVNVGTRPTFAGVGRRLEVHVIDGRSGAWLPLPGLPEYGWPLRVRLLSWVREDLRFDSVGSLCDQMARDIARCRDITETHSGVLV